MSEKVIHVSEEKFYVHAMNKPLPNKPSDPETLSRLEAVLSSIPPARTLNQPGAGPLNRRLEKNKIIRPDFRKNKNFSS